MAANYDYRCAPAVGGACANIPAVWARLSLINADEICFGEDMLVCFAGDVATGWVLACRQTIDRECKQAEMIMVQAMAVWRAWTTVASPLEVIDRLFEALPFGVLSGALCKRRQSGRDVIGRPMMPCATRSIRIVAEQHEATGLLPAGRSIPGEGRDLHRRR